jgi:hypothetical protein
MNEEIKRLQQLQRLRAATAACPFPSAAPGAGFFPSNNQSEQCLSNTGMSSSHPMLASLLAAQHQQQEETRLMLLQHQLRSSNMALGNQQMSPILQGRAAALPPLLNAAALPSPSSLVHQQQLHQQDSRPVCRVGAIEPFPEKLHRMLREVETAGQTDVISFINNGRGFAIHKPDAFFKTIVPLYFRHSRLSSFKRQLNLYGFEQINIGPYRGGYYHEMFSRDNPEMCRRMRRVAVKVQGANSQKKKAKEAAETKEDEEHDKAR